MVPPLERGVSDHPKTVGIQFDDALPDPEHVDVIGSPSLVDGDLWLATVEDDDGYLVPAPGEVDSAIEMLSIADAEVGPDGTFIVDLAAWQVALVRVFQ